MQLVHEGSYCKGSLVKSSSCESSAVNFMNSILLGFGKALNALAATCVSRKNSQLCKAIFLRIAIIILKKYVGVMIFGILVNSCLTLQC